MDISKFKTCKHYDSFFGSCNLYCEEVYLGEGESDMRPASIKYISQSECEYEPKKGENNDR